MARLLHTCRKAGQWTRYLSNFTAEQKAIEKHAGETAATWKYISLCVGLPVCGFLFYKNLIVGEEEHHSTWIPYDHIRIRKVPFPWGPESLFHSKHNLGPNQGEHEEEARKENFITAFIRNEMERHVKEDWKVQVEMLEYCHQKMLEHIERKKFPSYPPMPSYARVFGLPKYELHDPKSQRPIGFDD
ncbi:uncharacterized protein LOC130621780 [Hydractinia symbiolongicarpus]|uniref:uncharacterized protein LOC130621780 n=1 Tax=Hydractinia symbiolongicarpus TaxID=13093 RepID=UPI00254F8FCF|nr:uncharacterized protein LOC130621780 [Hydractinia symbiolongicarpus]